MKEDYLKAIFCRRPWPSAQHNILHSALSTALIIPVRVSSDDHSAISSDEWWWSKLRWSRLPSFASINLPRKRFSSDIPQQKHRRNTREANVEIEESNHNPTRFQTALKLMTPTTFKRRSKDAGAAEGTCGEVGCRLLTDGNVGFKEDENFQRNAYSDPKQGIYFL